MRNRAIGLIIIILILGAAIGAMIAKSDWTKLIGTTGGICIGYTLNELLRQFPKS